MMDKTLCACRKKRILRSYLYYLSHIIGIIAGLRTANQCLQRRHQGPVTRKMHTLPRPHSVFVELCDFSKRVVLTPMRVAASVIKQLPENSHPRGSTQRFYHLRHGHYFPIKYQRFQLMRKNCRFAHNVTPCPISSMQIYTHLVGQFLSTMQTDSFPKELPWLFVIICPSSHGSYFCADP